MIMCEVGILREYLGDLGTNAKELEDALEWHFYLAHKWDCVLLLDEADVFLSVRSPEDFQRNSLVAGESDSSNGDQHHYSSSNN